MHIKMIETRRGSEDGHTVGQFHAGDIYEVRDSLGRDFVRKGWATEIEGDAVPPSPLSGTAELVANVAVGFNQIFRPDNFRGGAVRNPGSFAAAGIDFEQVNDSTADKGEGV